MPKKAGSKGSILGPKGVKKSKRRGQKLKDSELRARLDKAVQERDEAKVQGLDPDGIDQTSIPKALSKLLQKPSQSKKPRVPEQLNDLLDGLSDLKTGSEKQ